MKKAEIIEAIEAAKIEGIQVSESMNVESLTRVYTMINSEEVMAAADSTIADLKAVVEQKDQTIEQYAKDIESLNAELQKATDVNATKGVVPTVKVEDLSYIVNFGVRIADKNFTIRQIESNEQLEIEGAEIGIAEYLVKIESPALQLIGA